MEKGEGLPDHYLRLKRRHGPFVNAVEALGREAHAAGPLEERSAQLIQLAAAAAIGSEGAVHSHVRQAVEAGATADEVRHALMLITGTVGFPRASAAISWADDLLGA